MNSPNPQFEIKSEESHTCISSSSAVPLNIGSLPCIDKNTQSLIVAHGDKHVKQLEPIIPTNSVADQSQNSFKPHTAKTSFYHDHIQEREPIFQSFVQSTNINPKPGIEEISTLQNEVSRKNVSKVREKNIDSILNRLKESHSEARIGESKPHTSETSFYHEDHIQAREPIFQSFDQSTNSNPKPDITEISTSQNEVSRENVSKVREKNIDSILNRLKESHSEARIGESKPHTSETFFYHEDHIQEREPIFQSFDQSTNSNPKPDIENILTSQNEVSRENVSKVREKNIDSILNRLKERHSEAHIGESILNEDSVDEIYPLINQFQDDIFGTHTNKSKIQIEEPRDPPVNTDREPYLLLYSDSNDKPNIYGENDTLTERFKEYAFEGRESIMNSFTNPFQISTEGPLQLQPETYGEPLAHTSVHQTKSRHRKPQSKPQSKKFTNKKKKVKKPAPQDVTYDCFVCTKSYTRKQELKRHAFVHTGETPFSCGLCDKAYSRKEELRRHQTTNHTNVKPYICEQCGKAFALKKHLVSHQLVHSGNKMHTCGDCGRAFLRKYDLSLHLLTHTGEKVHQCKWCEKSFSQKGDLNRHLLIHTREKPFVCEICNKAFTRKGDLEKHVTTHSAERPFACETCGKAYARKDKFNKHMRSHELEKALEASKQSCNECSATFLEDWELDNHMLTHNDEGNPYACDLCSRRFSNMEALLQHFLRHSAKDKAHVCNVCGIAFGSRAELKRHFLIHTGERPFVCEICNKAFSRKAILKDHRRTHGRVKEMD